MRDILRVEKGVRYTSIDGIRLKKIIVRSPAVVKKIRSYFEYTWEADIPFVDRYRLDNPEYKSGSPRILFFDIETLDLNVKSDNPIITMALYDSYTKEYITLGWREDKTKINIIEDNNVIMIYKTEYDMLRGFIDLVNSIDPDILTGWYSNGFDWPYLFNRFKKNKIDSAELSPLRYVNEERVRIAGRVCLDFMDAFKKVSGGGRDSFKLGEIAQTELGYGKTENPGDLSDLWFDDFERLLNYNRNDVQLLVELDKKLNIIGFFDMLSNMVNMNIQEGHFNTKIVDMYMLRISKDLNVVLPTKIRKETNERVIKGAMVFDPVPGLHENIAIFDLKSLYPSIIVSFNMSPETVIGLMQFKDDIMGIMPYALRGLFKQRELLKKQGSKNRQRVVKEIMNTFYGATLFRGFRLQNPKMGESITFVGRKILEWTRKVIEKEGYEVVYGDTDSVFVKGVTGSTATRLLDIINKSYDDFAKSYGLSSHQFKIELEYVAKTAFFKDVKKRYALLIDDEIKITGFEANRSNVPRLGRQVQRELLLMILKHAKAGEIKRFISKSRREVRTAPLENIGVPASVNKPLKDYANTPMHIRAVLWSNKNLKTEYGHGSKVILLFVRRVPQKYDKTDIIALEMGDPLPKGIEIDYDAHISRCVDGVTETVVGDIAEISNGETLDKFFK